MTKSIYILLTMTWHTLHGKHRKYNRYAGHGQKVLMLFRPRVWNPEVMTDNVNRTIWTKVPYGYSKSAKFLENAWLEPETFRSIYAHVLRAWRMHPSRVFCKRRRRRRKTPTTLDTNQTVVRRRKATTHTERYAGIVMSLRELQKGSTSGQVFCAAVQGRRN